MRTVNDWTTSVIGKNDVHVDDLITNGKQFTSAQTIVIAARKVNVTVENGVGSVAVPGDNTDGPGSFMAIGVIQNASVVQNKQLAQLFELGSRASYFVPGRTVVQANLSRIMIDGDSLMAIMYPTDENGFSAGTAGQMTSDPGFDTPQGHSFLINLASEFFDNPIDLAFWFNDGDHELMGGFYLKDAYLQSHQISVASQQTVVLESCSLRANSIQSVQSV